MKPRFECRPEFCVCGCAAKTTLSGNDADIAALYHDFFRAGRDQELKKLPGCQSGYYGLEWYTDGHKSFFYLLGKAVDASAPVPPGMMMKCVPAAQYAVVSLPAKSNLTDAWTQFFYTVIPESGYAPDEAHGCYFEYYPQDIHGACELWTPVIPRKEAL